MTTEELARVAHEYLMAELEHHHRDSEASLAAMLKAQSKLKRCVEVVLDGQKKLWDE
jgi:hypothetical protein